LNNVALSRPLVFINFETTGVNPSQDRIVELIALKVDRDGSEDERSIRLNPGVPMSEGAIRVWIVRLRRHQNRHSAFHEKIHSPPPKDNPLGEVHDLNGISADLDQFLFPCF